MAWPRKAHFKIVVFFAGFVALAIATAIVVRSNQTSGLPVTGRGPATAELYDEEGELVSAEETAEELSRRGPGTSAASGGDRIGSRAVGRFALAIRRRNVSRSVNVVGAYG